MASSGNILKTTLLRAREIARVTVGPQGRDSAASLTFQHYRRACVEMSFAASRCRARLLRNDRDRSHLSARTWTGASNTSFSRTSRDRRRGASWYRAPPKIELHDLIFRSTVLSASLPRFQPCASNGRLRRDEGLSTSLNSLLSTKRRRWRSESSPLAPLDRGCVEWQPASQTRPSLGFGRRRFLK